MVSTTSYFVPTEKEYEFIHVYVYYSLGGMNFMSHTTARRGMYLYVSPVEKKDGWVTTGAYRGFKTMMKEMKRKNKKEMAYAEEWVKENYEAIAKEFISSHDGAWDVIGTYGE